MSSVKLLSKYSRVDLKEGEISFEVEKSWEDRPAWIRLENDGDLPRFISISVPKFGELIYRSFGRYYYPFNYTNDEERRFMDAMAEEYDDMVAGAFNIPMAKALLDKIPLSEIPLKGKVLDLGCGTGIISEQLAMQGYRNLTLVDFSQGMLDSAKKKTSLRHAEFVQVDITKELPKRKYDLVVSVMLFNTFNSEKTDAVLKLLKPNLNKNAIFAVLEDTEKPSYRKLFTPIFSGMVNVANRTKYIFVGKENYS